MNKNHRLAKKEILRLESIRGEDIIRIDQNLITLPFFEEIIKRYDLISSIKLENGHWEMLKHFVKSNNLIAVVPTICVDKHDDDLIAKDLSDFFPPMSYAIASKSGVTKNKIILDFIAELKRTIRYKSCQF